MAVYDFYPKQNNITKVSFNTHLSPLGCCDNEKTIFDIDIEKILIIMSISIFGVVLSQDDIIYECGCFFVCLLVCFFFLNIYDNIIKNLEILP